MSAKRQRVDDDGAGGGGARGGAGDVVHDRGARRFVLAPPGAQNGDAVYLEYRVAGPLCGVLDFYHTWTPPALRGRGLAGRVVAAALEHARAGGLRVLPSCSYARRDSAEDFSRMNLQARTAMDWIFIPAHCCAIS